MTTETTEGVWTEEQLAALKRRDGFLLRGEEMTRLEMFSDAAFAFAMTMQVVAAENMPRTYPELVETLQGIPAFAASFAMIMMLWSAHRRWSRRFGLEDGYSVLLTLTLIFGVMVYIYPLRLMASVLFSWISGGRLPSELELSGAGDLPGLFMIYGAGYCALSGILCLLNLHVLKRSRDLGLNELEQVGTRFDATSWGINSAIGLASALMALLAPTPINLFSGFVYMLLPVLMPILGVRSARRMVEIGTRSTAGLSTGTGTAPTEESTLPLDEPKATL